MKKYSIIYILSTIAFINATFLTYKSFFRSKQTLCDFNSKFSCSNVLANTAANIAGTIPFSMVAMIIYPILLILAYRGQKTKSYDNFKILAILSFNTKNKSLSISIPRSTNIQDQCNCKEPCQSARQYGSKNKSN
jgi:uncharacterized membrane protein